MNKHKRCGRVYFNALRVLKNNYGSVEITVDPRPSLGRYRVYNIYGDIWEGKACCKWRARAKAIRALRAKIAGCP